MDNKNCSMMSSSSEEEQNSAPSPRQVTNVVLEQYEILMEQILLSPWSNVEDTEQQAVACSALNVIIPEIEMDTLKPMVLSFFERVSIMDLTQRESREKLAEMLFEVITTLSKLILDAFRNIMLEGRPGENPLLVSEKDVIRAVWTSLLDSFNAALSSIHPSMSALFELNIEEVTSHANFVLSCYQIKGKRLVFPKFTSLLGCGGCMPTKDHSAPAEHQEEEEPVEEEEERVPISKSKRLRETLGRCIPCGSRFEQPKCSDGAGSGTPPRARLCPMNCGRSERSKSSDGARRGEEQPRGSSRSPDSSRTSSIRAITEKVEDILLFGAMELCRTKETYLSHDSLRTASDIVQSITDNRQHYKISIHCWTGVFNKIKAFFTLSKAKATLRSLLRRLNCYVGTNLAVSVEEVIEEASPLLQELVHEGMDQVECKQLREKLTDIMSTRMGSGSERGVQMKIWNFTGLTSKMLHLQTQMPGLDNQVQSTLGRIHRLVSRLPSPNQARPSAQLTFIEPVPPPSQPINQEHTGPSEIPAESQVPTVDVPSATFEGQDYLAWQWSNEDCSGLVNEVVSRILQKNSDMMLPLSENLKAQFCEKVPQWNVLVKPSVRSCKEVASAVYKDLCKGQEKCHVMHAALVQDDFSSEVLDIIHRNLTAPLKKRRTLGSFLH